MSPPDAPFSVTHLVPSNYFGGAEQAAAGLVRRARARGESPRLATLRGTHAEAGLVAAVGPVVEGPVARHPERFAQSDGLRLAAHVLFQADPPRLVHAHLPWPDRLGLALLARGTRPAVVTFQLLPTHPLGGMGDVALAPFFSSRFAAGVARRLAPLVLVGLTDGDCARLRAEFPKARVERVFNAPAEPHGAPPPPLSFGLGVRLFSVGALSARKGHDRVLRALAAEPVRSMAFSLCIAGAGDERAPLERLAAELGIADRVRFVGQVPAPHLYGQADLFISGSRAEGLPLSLLEAMVSGTAVAASPIAPHREVLHGIPEALLDEDERRWPFDLQRLLADERGRRRLAALGKQRVEEEFSVSAQDAAYQRLYEDLAAT
jgi:glycosyltransferase involved in cell wall biosynthesis